VVWRGTLLAARSGMAVRARAACVIRTVGRVIGAEARRGAGKAAIAPVEAGRGERVAPEVERHDKHLKRGVDGALGV